MSCRARAVEAVRVVVTNVDALAAVSGSIRPCGRSDLPVIREIFNEVIRTSTALFEYEPRSLETVTQWFATKEAAGLPVLGCFARDSETLLGFTSYGPFRPFAAFRLTVEHSVYVHQAHRGQGVGRKLLEAIMAEARRSGIHLMVGGIEATNTASIELHRRFGFTHAGRIHEAGHKFERWLDLDFYEKRLNDHAEAQ
jgi:L-amino acid N-acyltransferase YncA